MTDVKDRKSPQYPTEGYCPKNPEKGHSHCMSDWSYWNFHPEAKKHPYCQRCGYVDRSRILDSYDGQPLQMIEKSDVRNLQGPIGPFGPMHRCHLDQASTVVGQQSIEKSPAGHDGTGRTLIIGYNPYMSKYAEREHGPGKWQCVFCHWPASDECAEYLDSLGTRVVPLNK